MYHLRDFVDPEAHANARTSAEPSLIWDISASRRRFVRERTEVHSPTGIDVLACGDLIWTDVDDLRAFRENGPSWCGGHPTIDKMTGAEGRSGQNVYADTSPGDLLPIGVPQIVALGELDVIVSASFGHAYATAAAASGDRVETLDLPGADHFDLIDPRSVAWQRVRQKILALLQ